MKDHSEIKSNEDLVSIKLHTEITKSSSQGPESSKDHTTQKKDAVNPKGVSATTQD